MSSTKLFHKGHLVIDENSDFRGTVNGNLTVSSGVNARIYGIVNGDLIAEENSLVTLYGILNGNIVDCGASITVHGLVNRPRRKSAI
ncbi:MAG: hypothetical protein K5905_21820 [Roseibium sp.]|uniref:hypothetical protein n=1 Tax=Roseibium sp. TaxID=1936156 RepID=UPI00260B033B|nr:hypothetical protein [Roseibium sp.]MCV0428103.1 hypothetical protein [Roseibium sp.]